MTDPKAASPQIKDMAGYIARNSNRANERQPHWRGKVRINGKEYLLSLWEKDGNADLMSLSVTDPATLPARPAAQGAPAAGAPAASGVGVSVSDPFGDMFGSLPGN